MKNKIIKVLIKWISCIGISLFMCILFNKLLDLKLDRDNIMSLSTTITFIPISLIALILGRIDSTILGTPLKLYLHEKTNYFIDIYTSILLFLTNLLIYIIIKPNIIPDRIYNGLFISVFCTTTILILLCIYKTINIVIYGDDYRRENIEQNLLDIKYLCEKNEKEEIFKIIYNITLETKEYINKYDFIRYNKNIAFLVKMILNISEAIREKQVDDKSLLRSIEFKLMQSIKEIAKCTNNNAIGAKELILIIDNQIVDKKLLRKTEKYIEEIIYHFKSITKESSKEYMNQYLFRYNSNELISDYMKLDQINDENLRVIYSKYLANIFKELYQDTVDIIDKSENIDARNN
ncbi:MAG: hypothetical protein E7J25_12825, partial [Paeniclostridium sordellii]|nr:hypothetical protein [Paeniclostridium sordellii]